jgi:ferredoxin
VNRFGDRIQIRTDDVGGLPTATELLGDCTDGTAVYACGPAPLLTAIRSELVDRDNVELHFERFAAPPVVDGKEFTVSVASTGETVRVGADETLLSALNRAGVHTSYSCQQGFCSTCRTRVLDGTAEHRDTLLTDPERDNGMMMICISRAGRGLVSDARSVAASVLFAHAVGRWCDVRGLHHRADARLGRHGRGLSGAAPATAPARRTEGAARVGVG